MIQRALFTSVPTRWGRAMKTLSEVEVEMIKEEERCFSQWLAASVQTIVT